MDHNIEHLAATYGVAPSTVADLARRHAVEYAEAVLAARDNLQVLFSKNAFELDPRVKDTRAIYAYYFKADLTKRPHPDISINKLAEFCTLYYGADDVDADKITADIEHLHSAMGAGQPIGDTIAHAVEIIRTRGRDALERMIEHAVMCEY